MKRSTRLILVLALPLALTACGDDGGGSAAPPLTSADLLAPGPYGVGVTTMTFTDTSRPTMPNGDFPGSPTRVLETEIWYPAAPTPGAPLEEQRDAPLARPDARCPLIVNSHGFAGNRTDTRLSSLLHLVTHGYLVAAPVFPLTNGNAPGGATILDMPQQPGDVSFVIDQLLALDGETGSRFFATVDSERIGLSGTGAGALTTYLAAFHPTLRDPRVRAAAPIANSLQGFSEAFFDNADAALLILDGELNAYVPYEGSVASFGQAHAPKYLAIVADGTLAGFSQIGCPALESVPNADEVGCLVYPYRGQVVYAPELFDLLGGADAGLTPWNFRACVQIEPYPPAIRPCRQHDLGILAVHAFFDAYLRDDRAARRFLESGLAAENAEMTVEFDR